MGHKEDKVRISKVCKQTDQFSLKSENYLKLIIGKKINRIMRDVLDIIELKFGKDFKGYEKLRAQILRSGNNSMREIETTIGENFNIQQIPDIIEYKKGQGNEKQR